MRTLHAAALFSLLLAACDQPALQPDAGPPDAGSKMDGGRPDAASPDAGSPDGGGMPDITIDSDILSGNAQLARMYFPPDSCEIAEACVEAPGWRTLLMFTTFTPNIGTADLNLGSNMLPDGGTNDNFEYSSCHMHYHFQGYAEYSLLNTDGSVAAVGHKQSFCVEDLEQIDTSPDIRTTPRFGNCGFAGSEQGIQRGWADDYYPDLPCQWIDVTDVPPGDYTLRVAINYEQRIPELNYDNDVAEVPFTIPADLGAVGDPTRPCTNDDPYQGIGRNCGWTREGVHTCTPGDRISVGCNAACGVGSCDDTYNGYDVRICRGDNKCGSADSVNMLQQDFGECGTGVFDLASDCGVARFTCPAEGQYTVLVAPEWVPDPPSDYGDPLTYCHLETVVEPASGSDGGTATLDGGVPDGGVSDGSVPAGG